MAPKLATPHQIKTPKAGGGASLDAAPAGVAMDRALDRAASARASSLGAGL